MGALSAANAKTWRLPSHRSLSTKLRLNVILPEKQARVFLALAFFLDTPVFFLLFFSFIIILENGTQLLLEIIHLWPIGKEPALKQQRGFEIMH